MARALNISGSDKKMSWLISSLSRVVLCFYFICFVNKAGYSQECPPNIDFESGSLDNWMCYTGSVAAVNGNHVFNLFPSNGPSFNRHTIIQGKATRLILMADSRQRHQTAAVIPSGWVMMKPVVRERGSPISLQYLPTKIFIH